MPLAVHWPCGHRDAEGPFPHVVRLKRLRTAVLLTTSHEWSFGNGMVHFS